MSQTLLMPGDVIAIAKNGLLNYGLFSRRTKHTVWIWTHSNNPEYVAHETIFRAIAGLPIEDRVIKIHIDQIHDSLYKPQVQLILIAFNRALPVTSKRGYKCLM